MPHARNSSKTAGAGAELTLTGQAGALLISVCHTAERKSSPSAQSSPRGPSGLCLITWRIRAVHHGNLGRCCSGTSRVQMAASRLRLPSDGSLNQSDVSIAVPVLKAFTSARLLALPEWPRPAAPAPPSCYWSTAYCTCSTRSVCAGRAAKAQLDPRTLR